MCDRPVLPAHHRIDQPPDALDLDGDHVARLEEHRGIAELADPARGARDDQVAGKAGDAQRRFDDATDASEVGHQDRVLGG